MAVSAALAAHSPSSTIRHSVIATASSMRHHAHPCAAVRHVLHQTFGGQVDQRRAHAALVTPNALGQFRFDQPLTGYDISVVDGGTQGVSGCAGRSPSCPTVEFGDEIVNDP